MSGPLVAWLPAVAPGNDWIWLVQCCLCVYLRGCGPLGKTASWRSACWIHCAPTQRAHLTPCLFVPRPGHAAPPGGSTRINLACLLSPMPVRFWRGPQVIQTQPIQDQLKDHGQWGTSAAWKLECKGLESWVGLQR